MAVSADRNLLFGILALQMDFISREQLIAGMQAWVLGKEVPLAEHLLAAGALLPEHRDLLDPLVRAHIRQHGDDPRRSLVAASLAGWVPPQLAALDDAQVQASLGHLPRRPSPASDPLATLAVPPESVHEAGSRFFVLRPHAEGGLGRVLVARDEELHREVALKEIRPEYAEDPTFRARFTLEAEITGGLEHPGIVPVYALGTHPDGSPYYVMRFIKGESFKDVIDAFHAASVSRSPSRQALELRKLLARFIDVCQAVGYAHSRGVLHRDLKPSNIMLGKYGETLVVDWGLAKTSRRSEPSPSTDPEPTLHPTSASSLEPTQMGSTVGTVGYMSPEQAQGRLDLLSPASDVFSLGATLYHLLTGRAPLAGAGIEELLPKARSGEFPRPRSIQRDIPPALEAICLKALAKDPAERYASAAALVDDVEHWLADEPVSACRETISERLARLARRHRTGLQAGIAALVLLSVVSSVTAFVVNAARQQAVAAATAERLAREEERQAKERERLAKEEERQAKELAQLAREQEHVARQLAEKRLAQVERGAEILGSVFWELNPKNEDAGGPPLLEVLGSQLSKAADQVAEEAVGDPVLVARLQTLLGSSLLKLGHAEPAVNVLAKALATREENLGLNHRDTLTTLDTLAAAHFSAGHVQEARPLFEVCLQRRQETLGPDDADTLTSRDNLAKVFRMAGDWKGAIPLIEQCWRQRQDTLGNDHPETLQTLGNLAAAHLDAGHASRALPLFEQCRDLSQARLGADHIDTLLAMNNLGAAYRRAGRPGQAIALHEECLQRMRAKVGESHPDTLTSLNNLAAAYQTNGQTAKSLPLLEQCWKLRRDKQGETHPHTLTAMSNLALAYKQAGKLDEAIVLHGRCLEMRRVRLGADHPSTLLSLSNLAEAHVAAGAADLAIPLLEECWQAQRGRLGPDDRVTLTTLNRLAEVCRAAGQFEKAKHLHRQCLESRRSTLGPDHAETLISLTNLAFAHKSAGEPAQALPLLEECLALRRTTLGDAAQPTLQSWRALAVTLAQAGRSSEAERQCDGLLAFLDQQSGPQADRHWRLVFQAGVDLCATTAEHRLALLCLERAIAKRDLWKPTAAEQVAVALGQADCHLFLKNYASAEREYAEVDAALPAHAPSASRSRAKLGRAAALAARGERAAAEQILAEHLPRLIAEAKQIPANQRRNVAAMCDLIIQGLETNSTTAPDASWSLQFDQFRAELARLTGNAAPEDASSLE